MSLFALYHPARRRPTPGSATRSPAISAAAPAIGRSSRRRWRPATASPPTVSPRRRAERAAALAALADDRDLFVGDETAFFAAPASQESLAALYARFPDAMLVGGATDVGLVDHQATARPQEIIWLGRVAGLDASAKAPTARSRSGAAATLTDATPQLAALHPDLGELMRRFGSAQVRASGTVGGNIANGSPIGDLAPALIALGGRSSCARAAQRACCRSRISSSPTASRIARPANTSARSTRRASRPASTIAPSRCPSGSTRTFPR